MQASGQKFILYNFYEFWWQREKEVLHKKIIELEAQLDQKQALELQIERIKGGIEVMKHMADEEDMEEKKKLEVIEEELRDKEEELEGLETLNSNLIVKELRANQEIQEARKQLIAVSFWFCLIVMNFASSPVISTV